MVMQKKKTIGNNNPLEAYLSFNQEEEQFVEHEKSSSETHKKKERITIHLPIHLIDRVKNAVYWEPGLTLTGFAEYAFEKALIEQEEKRGSAYPERKDRVLKSGRPVT
jgi:predicted DNA binding CopG/RHH family protein